MSTCIYSLKDIPKDAHWVIMKEESHHIPGDERSRTNPGHGYPASTVTSFTYESYLDEEEWKRDVSNLSLSEYSCDKNFVAFKSSGKVTVNKTVSININSI